MPGSEAASHDTGHVRPFVAFAEWRERARPGDKLPRGKFFRRCSPIVVVGPITPGAEPKASQPEMLKATSGSPDQENHAPEKPVTPDQQKVAMEPMPNFRSSGFASTWKPS